MSNIKRLHFVFQSATLNESLERAKKWLNMFYYLDLASVNNELSPQETVKLEAISANRQGYKYRVEWGLNDKNEFSIINKFDENSAATSDFFSPPMRHPDALFDRELYIQRESLGLSSFNEADQAELVFLRDLVIFDELTEEQTTRLNALEAQKLLTTEESASIQDLENKKALCKNWVVVPFYSSYWNNLPDGFKGTLKRVLGNYDSIERNLI